MWGRYLEVKNGLNRLLLMSSFNAYKDVSGETRFKYFLPLGQFIAVQLQPQILKSSKPRANPTQAISPSQRRALAKVSSVTVPNV